MPAVFGNQQCNGSLSRDMTVGRTGYEPCWSIKSQSSYPVRLWATDPTGLLAKAASRGVDPAVLLCPGCQTYLARLISEGKWPA
jgi:hypothetical protein